MANQKHTDAFSLVEQSVAKLSDQYRGAPFEWVLAFRLLRQLNWYGMEMIDSMLKAWEITAVEYLILGALYGADGYSLCVIELPERIGEKSSYVSRLVHQLKERGLLIRHVAADRRKAKITLTDTGANLLKRLVPPLFGMVEDQVREFSPGELTELVRLLKKMLGTYPGVVSDVQHSHPGW